MGVMTIYIWDRSYGVVILSGIVGILVAHIASGALALRMILLVMIKC